MKSLTLMLLVVFAVLTIGSMAVSAGELAPTQKSDAVQKAAVDDAVQKDASQKDASQKNSAVQKSAADEPVGFWERRREFRSSRIEARQARWTVAAVCRSGSCR